MNMTGGWTEEQCDDVVYFVERETQTQISRRIYEAWRPGERNAQQTNSGSDQDLGGGRLLPDQETR